MLDEDFIGSDDDGKEPEDQIGAFGDKREHFYGGYKVLIVLFKPRFSDNKLLRKSYSLISLNTQHEFLTLKVKESFIAFAKSKYLLKLFI